MITKSPMSAQKKPDLPLPLTLEILQGREKSLEFPVMVRSLSARGAILATYLAPENLNLDGISGRDAVIHLPPGEITEVRGSLLWARPRGEGDPEVVFGLVLDNANMKVRRALEEQLLAYPQDLKNLWDHWDAVHEDQEPMRFGQPVLGEGQRASRSEPAVARAAPVALQPQQEVSPADHTIYWVGLGSVLAGLFVYFLAPESYRLFGVILAAYGSLTMAGKSVWSMFQNRTWSQD